MNRSRHLDTFENEVEINKMITTLQRKGLEHMRQPDAFWDVKYHTIAIKSTHRMGKKVLANL